MQLVKGVQLHRPFQPPTDKSALVWEHRMHVEVVVLLKSVQRTTNEVRLTIPDGLSAN